MGSYTPPYVSVSPEVKVLDRRPDDAFVVMGSDGLWDFVSNEEAVHFVNQRLGTYHEQNTPLLQHIASCIKI